MLSALLLAGLASGDAEGWGLTSVGPATYRALYAPEEDAEPVPVPRFQMDRTPVTNAQFASFVAGHPEWRRDRVRRVFADEGYLGDWAEDDAPGAAVDPHAPVTRVSWFAAKAYCKARGATLPTVAQWEVAAAASETRPDGAADPAFVQGILAWYARPNPPSLPRVGRAAPNHWGVHDLHGLVWEWTLDFNTDLIDMDGRGAADDDARKFCGSGALDARDVSDYASFMRVSMRSSLEADYTTRNLGFRCVLEGT